jgi:putative flippase GtrA
LIRALGHFGWHGAPDVICGTAMAPVSPYQSVRLWFTEAWRSRHPSLKALSFALVGVVNTAVDYCVFLLARAGYGHSSVMLAAFAWLSGTCRCGTEQTMLLIAANITSWLVAVTGSYVMNSSITFAAESGRKLRWRDYVAFVISGVAGLIANTAALVFAAQVLMLPVWLAKAVAILVSFVVNFSLSHFVVFRVRA